MAGWLTTLAPFGLGRRLAELEVVELEFEPELEAEVGLQLEVSLELQEGVWESTWLLALLVLLLAK